MRAFGDICFGNTGSGEDTFAVMDFLDIGLTSDTGVTSDHLGRAHHQGRTHDGAIRGLLSELRDRRESRGNGAAEGTKG